MTIQEVFSGLTRDEARGIEQIMIEARGLKKNGGDLLNQINSISQNNPRYEELKKLGQEAIDRLRASSRSGAAP